MNEELKVLVICTAYNHEKYIRECLEGFVSQKTNFDYEVFVHDDCSTDNTANIIKEFESKYSNVIKPVYQSQNLYSQNLLRKFITEYTKNKHPKYIAVCEGDDCWIDTNKLQMQYDYMESHEDCYLYATGCKVNDLKFNKLYDNVIISEEKNLRFEDIISNHYLFNTCTFFMRQEVRTEMPKCFYHPYVGDIQQFFYAGILGYVHYNPTITAQYNYFTDGSWSQRKFNDVIEHYEYMIKMFININEYFNYKFNDIIIKQIELITCEILIFKKEYRRLKKEHKIIFKSYSTFKKIKINIGIIFPNIVDILVKIKRKFRTKW